MTSRTQSKRGMTKPIDMKSQQNQWEILLLWKLPLGLPIGKPRLLEPAVDAYSERASQGPGAVSAVRFTRIQDRDVVTSNMVLRMPLRSQARQTPRRSPFSLPGGRIRRVGLDDGRSRGGGEWKESRWGGATGKT